MQVLVLLVLSSFIVGGTPLGERLRRWPFLVMAGAVVAGAWYYRLGAVL